MCGATLGQRTNVSENTGSLRLMPQEGLLLGSALRGLELHLGKGRWEASGAQSHMMPLRGVCVCGGGGVAFSPGKEQAAGVWETCLAPGWPQLRSGLPFGPRSQASLQKAQGPGVLGFDPWVGKIP